MRRYGEERLSAVGKLLPLRPGSDIMYMYTLRPHTEMRELDNIPLVKYYLRTKWDLIRPTGTVQTSNILLGPSRSRLKPRMFEPIARIS